MYKYVKYIQMNKANVFFLKVLIALMLIFFSSCVTMKRSRFVYDDYYKKNGVARSQLVNKYNPTIRAKDELYIKVTAISSNSQETYNFFESISDNMRLEGSALGLISYPVDLSGHIKLPVLGKIKVAGLTLDEAIKKVESELENYINQPTVVIKFVNRNFTVLGEVNNPGTYEFSRQDVNIFQAIGQAGDFKTYGKKHKVMITRINEFGVIRENVDLTNPDIFNSEYYYLQDDDILYIEPYKRKYWGFETFPYSLFLSVASTTILVLSYIK